MKVGETKPNFTIEEAIEIHNNETDCETAHIIKRPIRRAESKSIMNGLRFYSDSCWNCMSCRWESEEMRTRTV